MSFKLGTEWVAAKVKKNSTLFPSNSDLVHDNYQ